MTDNRRKQEREGAAGRLPAVPLITCDPYFSLWSGSDRLCEAETMHWTGRTKKTAGVVTIDGKRYRFMGLGTEEAMEQTSLCVTATCTQYCFEKAGIALEISFWTPLLPNDLDILSRPCSYLDAKMHALDGKEHQVELEWEFLGDLCCNKGQLEKIGGGAYQMEGNSIAWMGLREQSPLGHSGDGVTIDWGYFYLAALENERVTVTYQNAKKTVCGKVAVTVKESDECISFVAAYDDLASIYYFGRMQPGYWARKGKTIQTAITEAIAQHDELKKQCEAFEADLEEKTGSFGPAYTKICSAAYRQVIGAHKLIADENEDAVLISKECFSNGCAATVDITYPSAPLFFCCNPELVRAMMRPITRFAKMPVWKYDFAPHDAGRYPYVTGQVYGLSEEQNSAQNLRETQREEAVFPMLYQMPASANVYQFENQMPVEESGNMLILEAQLMQQEPEKEKAIFMENISLYEKWVTYLVTYGSDPGEQLCTDDFAGHLAHNINLAIKAIMGVEGYGILMDAIGREKEARSYHEKAAEMAKDVYKRAFDTDHTKLTFDADGNSWSLKYNAVWDLIFGSKLWPTQFYKDEMAQYRKVCRPYGVPLDSRETYTKSDWMMWAASMDPEKKAVEEFAEKILKFLEESPDRVPFSDWYYTENGKQRGFQNRTVQGGLFMPLLCDRISEK